MKFKEYLNEGGSIERAYKLFVEITKTHIEQHQKDGNTKEANIQKDLLKYAVPINKLSDNDKLYFVSKYMHFNPNNDPSGSIEQQGGMPADFLSYDYIANDKRILKMGPFAYYLDDVNELAYWKKQILKNKIKSWKDIE